MALEVESSTCNRIQERISAATRQHAVKDCLDSRGSAQRYKCDESKNASSPRPMFPSRPSTMMTIRRPKLPSLAISYARGCPSSRVPGLSFPALESSPVSSRFKIFVCYEISQYQSKMSTRKRKQDEEEELVELPEDGSEEE